MVGVWLVVLASSPTLYGKVPRLILKKTSRLTQAVVFFRRHFLCGALLCNCSSAEREGLSTHYTTRVFSRTLYAQNPITKNLHISPRSSPTIFYRDANSVLLLLISHLCTALLIGSMRRTLCSKFYLHMYNGNVQQNPLCVESCVSKEFSISPRLSPTIFDPDANSVLLRAHTCTAVDSMRRKPCVRNYSREREGLYNGNAQQNPICAASCVTKDIPISPRFTPTFFYRRANPSPYSAPFFIHSSPN